MGPMAKSNADPNQLMGSDRSNSARAQRKAEGGRAAREESNRRPNQVSMNVMRAGAEADADRSAAGR
jgi:hypothetical protein